MSTSARIVRRRSWRTALTWGAAPATAIVLLFLWWQVGQPATAPGTPSLVPAPSGLAQQPTSSSPEPTVDAESRPIADARLQEALAEAQRLESVLAAMELRKVEMERTMMDLAARTAQAELETAKAHEVLASATNNQEQLVHDVERLSGKRRDLTQELELAMKTIRTATEESARSQERADLLAKDIAKRLPGPLPATPTRLELRYDRDAMTTIGRVVRSDGSSEDLAPVPWPREGAKVLVSASKDEVGRQFTDLVIAHYQMIAQRQRLIGELQGDAEELARLDRSGRHAALVAEVKRLGSEKP